MKKRKTIISIVLFFSLLILFSCEMDNLPEPEKKTVDYDTITWQHVGSELHKLMEMSNETFDKLESKP